MKRVLSLVLSLVLVLGMMPSFAASASGAEELYSNGFITGANGDLMVEKSLTRAEMAVILSELFGVKEEAMNFAVPANFTDVNDHWAASYIAYGQEAGWFGGYPDGTYKPEGVVSGNELASFVLNALGYQGDYTFAEALEVAATMGIEVPSKAILTRGDAFGSIWTTVNTPAKGDTVALGVKLGKLEPVVVVPTELKVESVKADTLVQVEVVYNQKVDEDSAEDVDNYDWDDNDTENVIKAELQEDGMTVLLTLGSGTTIKPMGQQDKDTLKISDVKSENEKVTIADTEVEVTFLDQDLPTVEAVEVVGVSTIKVTFSEPMDPAEVEKDDFKAKDGKYYIKDVTGQKNNTEFLVELYTSLTTGSLQFEVKTASKDYAGFTAIGKVFTLDVVEDTTLPTVIGFSDADENEVTLIWSEDIEFNGTVDEDDYYHTNSNNIVDVISGKPQVTIDGNEMTLKFDDKHSLPETAYVYVLEDAVRDLWKNKNDQQMIEVDVTADETAPVLDDIDVDYNETTKRTELTLTFSEDVTKVDRKDFTTLDKDGDEIDVKLASATVKEDEVTLVYVEELDGGDYTLVVKDIEDLAGNDIANTSMSFTVTDLSAPDLSKIKVQYYEKAVGTPTTYDYIIRVSFPESMTTEGVYAINDMEKYIIKDKNGKSYNLKDIDDAEIDVVSDGKAVEITFNSSDAFVIVSNDDTLQVARVADTAGNYSVELASAAEPMVNSNNATIGIEKVELKTVDTIKVTFAEEIDKFTASDIKFYNSATSTTEVVPESVDTDLNDDGNTVVTYTFDEDFNSDATNAYYATAATADLKSTNDYGNKITQDLTKDMVTDKCKPALHVTKDADEDEVDDVVATTGTTVDTIKLTFTESLLSGYISNGMFDVSGYDADEITAVRLVGTNVIEIDVKSDNGAHIEEGATVTLTGSLSDSKTNILTELDTEIYKVQ